MQSKNESSPIMRWVWNSTGVLISSLFGFWGVVLLIGAVSASYAKRNGTPQPDIALENSSQLRNAAPKPAVHADAEPASTDLSEGKQIYNSVCIACHQGNGQGIPNMFPRLTDSDWVSAPKPDRLIRIVLHGLMGPISIKGEPFNTPAPMMPPQGGALTDQQIASVLTFIRRTWSDQTTPVTAEQVAAIRLAENGRSAMWTEADLNSVPDR